MRISMVLSKLPPLGGIEAALVPLVRELKARGHDVRLYVLQRPPQPNQHIEALRQVGVAISTPRGGSFHLARFAVARKLGIVRCLCALALPGLLPLAAVRVLRHRRGVVRSIRGAAGGLGKWLWPRLPFEHLPYGALGRQFRRLPPDVVHFHGWGCGEDPPGALSWARRRGLPVVYTEHSSPDPRRSAPIDQAPMNLADVLIAVSEAGRRGLETVGRADRPIRLIAYGVDPLPATERLEERHDDFVVTCVARLVPSKGQTHLIEALARIRPVVPQACLLLAGIGPSESELRERARRLGLEKRVEFLGLITRSELPELYARTDVVTLASDSEGLPVSLIEALSAGKPIVASDAGGNPELVRQGENGLIVGLADVAGLAAALLQLANDPVGRDRMGAASAARFRGGEFAPSKAADLHLDAYRLTVELWQARGQEALAVERG